MQTIVREMRSMPLWLLHGYLVDLGGAAADDFTVRGAGWEARLERMEPFRLGSLEVGQVRVTIEIEDERAEKFMEGFARKTFRAGG